MRLGSTHKTKTKPNQTAKLKMVPMSCLVLHSKEYVLAGDVCACTAPLPSPARPPQLSDSAAPVGLLVSMPLPGIAAPPTALPGVEAQGSLQLCLGEPGVPPLAVLKFGAHRPTAHSVGCSGRAHRSDRRSPGHCSAAAAAAAARAEAGQDGVVLPSVSRLCRSQWAKAAGRRTPHLASAAVRPAALRMLSLPALRISPPHLAGMSPQPWLLAK